MNVTAIRQGLATAVASVTGIEQSLALTPTTILPPAFAVVEYDLDYHQTFSVGGLKALTFTCMLWTSTADHDNGLQTLDAYLTDTGAGSILAAIEADKTLGGACGTLVVDGVTGVGRQYGIGEVSEDYYGAQINVRVWAT